jgi:hypothetical protein
MQWSYLNWLTSAAAPPVGALDRVGVWLADTPLFAQAWGAVCGGPAAWYWSEQLCLYTAAGWTGLLFFECKRLSL